MSEKQRFFIEISYDGSNYHGWQLQPNAVTVQQLLDAALTTVLRSPIQTTGCGRTDTGVHATRFFAHFDLHPPAPPLSGLLHSVNAILPADIAAKGIIPVGQQSHARFDATLRSYTYHIHFRKDPFLVNRSWELREVPDVARMNEAAAILSAYTDFSCFSKSNTQTFTNNCKIYRAEWTEEAEGLIFHISADRFLRNMVRAIVGTLLLVGRGEAEPGAIREIIESKNRSKAGTSVPACGLYLTDVQYPYSEDWNWRNRPEP